MFEQLKPLLFFILPASVICTLVGLWAWWRTPGRKAVASGTPIEAPVRDPNLPLALLVPMLLIAGWSLTLQPFAWRPHATIEWMPYVIALGGVLVLVNGLISIGLRMNDPVPFQTIALLACGVVVWALSLSTIQNRGGISGAAGLVSTGTFASAAVFLALRRPAQERSGIPALQFVVVGALSSAMMLLSGEIKMPMLVGAVCACVGPGLMVSLVRPAFSLGLLIVPPALCLVAAWYYAVTLGETPKWCAALALLSVVLMPLSSMGPTVRLAGWKRWLVRCTLVALPGLMGLGILVAQRASQTTPEW